MTLGDLLYAGWALVAGRVPARWYLAAWAIDGRPPRWRSSWFLLRYPHSWPQAQVFRPVARSA